ncbi:MAG TPA: glycerol kinase GlpK [Verrucomicrobiae bacterium]|nr:glycerol kinase GlpK [Verrucomicrobiae bacterium]
MATGERAGCIGALDQGTSSTRFLIVDRQARVVARHQLEHRQITPRPGWVEHDPLEIWGNTQQVIRGALESAGMVAADLSAVGIANQRETVVLWDRRTGRPVHNAVVWLDTRTDALCRQLAAEGGPDRFRAATGLPLATYFSGPKLRWLLDRLPGIRARAEAGEVLAGTIDSWLIWNLTGGTEGGRHITDVSNASRTQLMNLASLDWDPEICATLGVPIAMLPEIHASSEVYGRAVAPLAGVPVAGDLGDQQAALVGQAGFTVGATKCTYGTGSFLLVNTGPRPVPSRHGLLTTVAYRIDGHSVVYALEGSIAVTGALVQWLRDNLGLIRTAAEVETVAGTVADAGGVCIVPAFSGLFAPHWRSDARGVITGLTSHTHRGHIARAALDAAAWQTREVVDAMAADTGASLTELRVDGGMVRNDLLMQLQADVLGVPVVRPQECETTALGAAFAAGLAVRVWSDTAELAQSWRADRRWLPRIGAAERADGYRRWQWAVTRALGWGDPP